MSRGGYPRAVLPESATEIHAFLAFVRELGDPLLATQRKGASVEQIERLRSLVRHPLPPLYEGFLEQMGEESLVSIGRDGRQRIGELIHWYETQRDQFPPQTVVICTPAISPATLLVYDDEETEPFVTTAYDHELGPIEAPSFAHHLYRCAWCVALWPNNTQLTVRDGDAEAVAESAVRAGFERLWFSGGTGFCLDEGITQLWIEQQGPVARAVIMSRSEGARERFARWLVRRHGARRI